MAKFEGTIKEFTQFIGPYARIKVAFLASKYKKQKGKCEDCGIEKGLEAAHIKGKERPLLIANILSEFIVDDIITVDLNEFEEKYKEIHLPIESSIKILCADCHRKYDKAGKSNPVIKEKVSLQDESVIIENLVKSTMNKSKALQLANKSNYSNLNDTNTIFSNIIDVHQGWWLQPFNHKFEKDLYMILHENRSKKLYLFRIPAHTINNPSSYFKQRNDKYRTNCSDIYIATSGLNFKEKDGFFDFTSFLIEQIQY